MTKYRKPNITDAEMVRLYVEERRSSVDIGFMAGVSEGQVRYRLHAAGVTMRSRRDRVVGRKRACFWYGVA